MSYEGPQSDPPPHPLPPFRLYAPEVDFIENRLPEYHEAFIPSKIRYDAGKRQFVGLVPGQSQNLIIPNASPPSQPRPVPGAVVDMKFWDELFPNAMEYLNSESTVQSKHDGEWGIRNLSKWQDVQAKLEKARQVYDFENSSQNVGKVRRKVRSLMDSHHAIVQQAVKVVPNSDIATPIVGVINIIVDTYIKAAEVRHEVNSSLENLPDSFAKMDFYLQSYPKDANIVQASTNLVVAIFKAIENSIRFYTSGQAKRAGIAVLAGSQYQSNLVRSLTEMKDCCNELENQARLSFNHRMMGDNDRMFRELSRANVGLSALLYGHHTQTAGVLWMRDMFNCVLSILSDKERNGPPHSPSPLRPLTPQSIQIPDLTPRELWSRLHIPNLDETDLQYVASRVEEMLHQDRGRAQQVVTTRLFLNWINSTGSAKLLLHGDFRTAEDLSPSSSLCAILTYTFRESGRFVSLVFFCGCHLIWNEHHGGTIMIRSLIAQLLRQFPSQHLWPDSQTFIEGMDLGNVESLCSLFTYLVGQMASRLPIICLIDGIGFYETEEYLDDMTTVILSLIDIVHDASNDRRPPFKLLLTSPRPTTEVRKIFDPDPHALLHMESMPLPETSMEVVGFQEQLATEI